MRTLRPPFIQGWPLLCGPQIERAANIRNRILRLGHAAIRIARKDIETTEKEITMETNHIIEELRAKAALDWNPEQKAWFEQQANDARPVQCVRMRDAFTPDQLRFLFQMMGYKTQQKMCYRNAAYLVERVAWMAGHFDPDVPETKYVEGFAYAYGLLPIEHAFVKVGDLYVDPTFERALHRDVRNEIYVSCIELDPLTMANYLLETGYYGELYVYDYMCKNRPELAAQIRARNPHNRR